MPASPYDKIPLGFAALMVLSGLYLLSKLVIGNDNNLELPVTAIAVQEQGLIASGDQDGIKVWDKSVCILRIKEKDGKISSLAFSKDGKLLASGSKDGAVKVWSVSDGSLHSKSYCHPAAVSSVTFSQEDRYVVSTSTSDSLLIWDWQKQQMHLLKTNKPHFSINDLNVLAYVDTALALNLVDLNAMEFKASYPGIGGFPRFMPDNKTIALYKDHGVFQLINSANGKIEREFETYYKIIENFLVAPDGKTFILSCLVEGDVHIWDASANILVATLGGDTTTVKVSKLAIKGDSSLLTGNSLIISSWSLPSGRYETELVKAAPRFRFKDLGIPVLFMLLTLLSGFIVLFFDRKNSYAALAVLSALAIWEFSSFLLSASTSVRLLYFLIIPVLLAALICYRSSYATVILWVSLVLSALTAIIPYAGPFLALSNIPVIFLAGYVLLRRGRQRYAVIIPICFALLGFSWLLFAIGWL